MYTYEGSGAVATTPLRGVAAESPEPAKVRLRLHSYKIYGTASLRLGLRQLGTNLTEGHPQVRDILKLETCPQLETLVPNSSPAFRSLRNEFFLFFLFIIANRLRLGLIYPVKKFAIEIYYYLNTYGFSCSTGSTSSETNSHTLCVGDVLVKDWYVSSLS